MLLRLQTDQRMQPIWEATVDWSDDLVAFFVIEAINVFFHAKSNAKRRAKLRDELEHIKSALSDAKKFRAPGAMTRLLGDYWAVHKQMRTDWRISSMRMQ